MIGLIVTGHGSYASGISSALSLISGMPDAYQYVDFTPDMSSETLEDKLQDAMNRLDCKQILICTDLKGGTPFNVAAKIKMSNPDCIEVIAGTNFPLILEASMLRMMDMDLAALAKQVVNSGKDQIMIYEPVLIDDGEFDE